MRHVSRTHRVALDWLFDRIYLDPQNPNGSKHRGYRLPTPPPCALRLPGCRCLKLDQCAAVRTRTALASPSPLAERDKVDRVCAAVEAFGVPRISLRQDHTSSGLSVRSQKLALVGATHEEEEASSLGIIHPRMLDESFMADGNPQNFQARRRCGWTCSEGREVGVNG